MKKELVSICIPAYNSGRYIRETIESVRAQTYRELEILVVDDASADDTVAVVRKLQKADGRIRLICNDRNLGMVENWTKAITQSRGKYVKLLPADDLLYPDCIAQSVAVLKRHKEVSLVVGRTDLVNDAGEKIGRYPHPPLSGIYDGDKMIKWSVLITQMYGNPVCALFRRADFDRFAAFDPKIPYILDFDLWIALSAFGRIAVLRQVNNAFRVRTDSNTGKLVGKERRKYNAEHIRLIRKYEKTGVLHLTPFAYAFAVFFRWLRNYLIAGFVRIKNKK